jgi:hypothetical protein
MEITCSELKNKKGVIAYFYDSEDENFFRDIHKKGGTKDECIEDTLSSMEDDFVYGVFLGDELAAFFSKYENESGQVLNAFHVFKEFRNSIFLRQFWDTVKSKFEKNIYCSLCVKNKPAIRSLAMAGFEFVKEMKHENNMFLILKFKI